MTKKTVRKKSNKSIEIITHDEASRKHIPTAELESVLGEEVKSPIQVAYERRNRDLDPQLVWRGKDDQAWADLIVQASPLYIQEKIHPKVLIDDLHRITESARHNDELEQLDLFADFNGLPEEASKTDFYQHDANWSNRMILGDNLQVMASLAEREGLRGQVQCIYIDPPYGIKFNSNFQWSTTSRDVQDGKAEHITREPEMVKAFRDTWRDGIHTYLTYLRDRFLVAHDLLHLSGSIFVQIGDENEHKVRSVLDEIFGEENFIAAINFRKTGALPSKTIASVTDILLWYSKDKETIKIRQLFQIKGENSTAYPGYDYVEMSDTLRRRLSFEEKNNTKLLEKDAKIFSPISLESGGWSDKGSQQFVFRKKKYIPRSNAHWKTTQDGLERIRKSNRIHISGSKLRYVMYQDDFPLISSTNIWDDTMGATNMKYVVQTNEIVSRRAILMTTDPGDLVLDPTCGSGTSSFVAEQWGRRWITIDTSRVALALTRARLMGARYPYYLLRDSRDGQLKEAELVRKVPADEPTSGRVRQGFVYERIHHIMLRDIANNLEIDIIWEKYQNELEPIHDQLNQTLNKSWQEWEIPREADKSWCEEAKNLHGQWWQIRVDRQKEIDASIAANAQVEYLYDKPYKDNRKVRVAGPFTVESLAPHRVLGVDEHDELIDPLAEGKEAYGDGQSFEHLILENLRSAGVQQAHKEDKIEFSSLTPWPGRYICAEGRYFKGKEDKGDEKRAAIFIGPEFGTVSRPDLVTAAREAGDADFDVLIACAFSYDAQSTEFDKLGKVPVLKARMNADLHMADDLKNTGKGNLFVIFGEPDIEILTTDDGKYIVQINGVDVFDPSTGEVRSDGAEGIACWFVDTDYNEESFFVRQAYFLGANDPYKSLKTTLKAEINHEAWETLHSNTSRPFDKPVSGRIAVKVINHLGDEVMKVFQVG